MSDKGKKALKILILGHHKVHLSLTQIQVWDKAPDTSRQHLVIHTAQNK